ncbi:MAG: GNAT family N-acetyltransferase [Eubacteriales bacterium]
MIENNIKYQNTLENISPKMLDSFCVGWSKPLDGEKIFAILENSYKFSLAMDNKKVVGFVQAISDKVKFAFIPMLEVLPEYQGKGIGTELMKNILSQLECIDNIDLICDAELQPYYEKLGMMKYTGMVIRK